MKLQEKKVVQLVIEEDEIQMVYQALKYALHRITKHRKAGSVGTEDQVRKFIEEFDRQLRK
jgi:hypothetical protein